MRITKKNFSIGGDDCLCISGMMSKPREILGGVCEIDRCIPDVIANYSRAFI